jgi:DNA-directed RNA polymerase subunit M/transcription elongation factor TFIIS
MVTKIETTEHLLCDLCGHEVSPPEAVTLYRSDNKITAAKKMASSLMRQEENPGQANVDICPACRQRPVGEVLALMYPAQS